MIRIKVEQEKSDGFFLRGIYRSVRKLYADNGYLVDFRFSLLGFGKLKWENIRFYVFKITRVLIHEAQPAIKYQLGGISTKSKSSCLFRIQWTKLIGQEFLIEVELMFVTFVFRKKCPTK